MKCVWVALLVAVLAIGIAACGAKSMDENALKKIAAESVSELVAGDYAAVEKRMSRACAAKLSAAALGNAWEATVSQLGAFAAQTGSTAAAAGTRTTVAVTCEFTVKELLVSFTFSGSGKIEGLWLSYGKAIEQPLESSEVFEEAAVEIGNGATKLSGKLMLPKGVEKPPVVVMVQGSGTQDMDSTIGKAGNKPFRDIAQGLAKQGIATIRYDKRYFAYPQEAQSAASITIEGEVVKDVTAALELAETDPRVDNDRVYVLGHSLGGMLAPKIAYDNPPVKGIISLAGSLRGLEDIIWDQNIEALENSDLSEQKKAEALKKVEEEVQKVKNLTKSRRTSSIFGQPASYWASLNSYHGAEYVKKLTIPMLILQGDADFQCSVEKDYQSWRNALEDKSNVTYWVYGGLNHLFMPTTGVRDLSDYDAPNQVDQKVIDDIGAWVATH